MRKYVRNVITNERRKYLFLDKSNQVRLDKLPIAGLIFAILLSEAFNTLFREKQSDQKLQKIWIKGKEPEGWIGT